MPLAGSPASSAPKWAHTWDATRSQITFSKASWYKVEALGVREAGEYPVPTPPPPPPSVGMKVEHFTDVLNTDWTETFINRWQKPPAPSWTVLGYEGIPWSDGSGIYEIDTPHGPGFDFIQGAAVPRGDGAGVQMADVDHWVDRQDYLGKTSEWLGKFILPSDGNPNGFPRFADWDAFWEWTEGEFVANQFGIDGFDNRLYVRTFDANSNWTRKAKSAAPLVLDRWYDWRWQIKWERGSVGFANFWLDGQQLAAWTGPTLPWDHSPPYLQWGWYGGDEPARNRVQYAGLRIVS